MLGCRFWREKREVTQAPKRRRKEKRKEKDLMGMKVLVEMEGGKERRFLVS
jgi:hypothetical protein